MKPSEQIKQLKEQLEQAQTENAKLNTQVKLLSPVVHPVSKTNYIFAFEIEGEKFYKWQSVSDIPTSRKLYADGLIQSTSLVLNVPDQKLYWAECLKWAMAGDMEKIKLVTIEALKRIESLSHPKLIFMVMAMLYLKKDDDIQLDLPVKELERRAQLFESSKKKTLNEIFSLPMSSILGSQETMKPITKTSSKEKERLIKTIQAQEFLADSSKKALKALSAIPTSSKSQNT